MEAWQLHATFDVSTLCKIVIMPTALGTLLLQVWSIINQKVSPYVRQMGPVQTAINYAQRWFLSVGRA